MEPTTEQLNNRALATSGTSATATATPTSTTPATSTQDDFLSELQKRLLSSSDMVSSAPTEIESAITKAMETTKAGAEAGKAKIQSEYERIAGESRLAGQRKLSAAQEAQRGFATNTAQLQQIEEATNKDLKDLEMRKNELILSGDATAAARISDLQLKSLEFKQEAKQKIFSNLLNLGQFSIQAKAEERASQQFKDNLKFQKDTMDFNRQSKMAELATTWGVTIDPGETLETLTAKIKPMASKKQQAELDKLAKDNKRENDLWTLDQALEEELSKENVSPAQAVERVMDIASFYKIPLSGADYKRNLDKAVEIKKMKDEARQMEVNKMNEASEVMRTLMTPLKTTRSNKSTQPIRKASPFTGVDISGAMTEAENPFVDIFNNIFGE